MTRQFWLFAAAILAASGFLAIAIGMAEHRAGLLAPFNLFLFVLLLALYVVPSALAVFRNCSATPWIIALNILLGWTFFGWAIALGWAATGKVAATHPTLGSPSGPALQGH